MYAAVIHEFGQAPRCARGSWRRPRRASMWWSVEVGDRAGKTVSLLGGTLRSIDLHLSGSGFGSNSMAQILGTVAGLFRMAAEGKLRVEAIPVPLAEVEAAWGRNQKGNRLVVTI